MTRQGQAPPPQVETAPETMAGVPLPLDDPSSIPLGADTTAAAAPADITSDAAPGPTLDDARRALAEGRHADAISQSRELLAGTLPSRQRRLALEIVARALAGQNRAAEAQAAFADLMRRYPAYTPDPSLSQAERAAYEAARTAADQAAAAAPSTPAAPTPAPSAPVTTATINVKVEPFADFFVNDQRLDGNKKQFRATVPPGTHRVKVTHPSLGEREWRVTLTAGQTQELEYDFTSVAGSITVTAEPTWGDIYMNGVRIGHTTPWTISPVPPGEHDITIVREGYVVEGGAQRVNIKVREHLNLKFRLKKR
jgi:hypothetical protein